MRYLVMRRAVSRQTCQVLTIDRTTPELTALIAPAGRTGRDVTTIDHIESIIIDVPTVRGQRPVDDDDDDPVGRSRMSASDGSKQPAKALRSAALLRPRKGKASASAVDSHIAPVLL